MQPFTVNRRRPRAAGETGFGADVPGAITLSGGRVAAFSYSVSNTMVQSPGSVSANVAVNSPFAALAFASDLTAYHVAYGDWRRMFTDIEVMQKITADDVKRVATKYLVPERRTVAWTYQPKEGK